MAYQFVREPLRPEEADRMSNACETVQEKLIVWVLLDTGLRVGELCSLKQENILWQQRALMINGKGGPYGKKTKKRVVPMSPRVKTLLEHYFSINTEWFVERRQAYNIVKRVANRARISQKVCPHVLRHTFAVLALHDGIDIVTINKILGHSDIRTTMIYLNISNPHIVDEFSRKWGQRGLPQQTYARHW